MAVLKLDRWNLAIGDGQPLVVIAGLNVLEDLEPGADRRHAICRRSAAELGLPYVFKASFDKANRSSIKSYRGPGLEDGPGDPGRGEAGQRAGRHRHPRARAGRGGRRGRRPGADPGLPLPPDRPRGGGGPRTGGRRLLHVKKGQFLAPWDCKNIVDKIREAATRTDHHPAASAAPRSATTTWSSTCWRIAEMQKLGVPVTIDATHAVQLPGADPRPAAPRPAAGARACR